MANERLREALLDAGQPINEIAKRLGVHPKTVGHWVNGRRPHRRYQYAIGSLLGTDPALIWPDGEEPVHPNELPSPGDEMALIGARLHRLTSTNVDAATIRHVDLTLEEIATDYEANGAAAGYPVARRHRQWIEELLEHGQRPKERVALLARAGKLSGVLGYLAFDLGHRALALAYLDEAATVADLAGDTDLMAWVRGQQSFVSLYTGRYQDALDYARDGQRHAAGGPQATRLAVAGEARALGKLNDVAGVAEAVDRALQAHERHPGEHPVGQFLSSGPLGSGRLYGNAASAFLAVGDRARAKECARKALDVFTTEESQASRSLTLLDLATAKLSGADPDLPGAAEVIGGAMAAGGALRSDVVVGRTSELLLASRRWEGDRDLGAMVEAVAEWRTRAVPPSR